MSESKEEVFTELCQVIARLRDPKTGCPWDIKQTHSSLKPYLIEESYEALDAIDSGQPVALKEELGDVLLQVMLHSQIAEDNHQFSVADVIAGLTNKLIERHPHVFSTATVSSAEEVTENWQKNKQRDKQQSLIGNIARSLPALARADLIGKRVATIGFDWDTPAAVKAKVMEELRESNQAEAARDQSALEEEFGDLLFSLAQLARKHNFDAETALAQACTKFAKRFHNMEARCGGSLDGKSKAELEELWLAAKAELDAE